MANSITSICNVALALLGEDLILTIENPTTKVQKTCNLFYQRARNAVLAIYPWNFATKRLTLQQSVTTPVYGYLYAYPLPADYIKLQDMQDSDLYAYEIESGSIVTDAATCKIKYTYEVTDSGSFSEAFSMLLSHRLAAMMAIAITGKRTLAADMWQLYDQVEIQFFSVDSQEGAAIADTEDDLINVR